MCKYYNWKNGINEDELNEVVQILKNDGVIIFPTETVYGIGGNALSSSVVNRVYEIKKRPREKAINILLSSTQEIEKYAKIESDIEKKIIKKFMPGPISLILNKKDNIGDGFTLDNNTIGIRVPDSEIIHQILSRVDFPLIAPSANISGKPSGIQIEDIINDFKDKVEAIIDGGKAKLGLSSTIVKVENNEIVILRQGTISEQDLIFGDGEKNKLKFWGRSKKVK